MAAATAKAKESREDAKARRSAKMDKLAALKELTLFEKIEEATLQPLLDYFIVKRFERDDVLWREGAEAMNFTFIVEGKIKISKGRNDGREVILGVFGQDESVGHIAVYSHERYPASAVALEDTLVLEIYRGHFYGTIQRTPLLLEAIMLNMMSRNRELVHRVHEVTISGAEQRLALLFCKFSESVGRRVKLENGQWGVFIGMPLSRNDLSELINVRVETAIRLMSRWNKEGPIRTEKQGFTVTDPDALLELSQCSD